MAVSPLSRLASKIKSYLRPISGKYLEPSFIIIGAQKAGTTALWQYLSTHPAIAASATKEINFFSCNSRYELGLNFYHPHFPLKVSENAEKLTFEASPDYLRSPIAAQRIYAYNPNLKLIALLRDPMTRAYSAWHMYRRYYQENRNWFFDWVQMCDSSSQPDAFIKRATSFGHSFEDDILAELNALERGGKIEMHLLEHGLYHQQLQTYYQFFPRAQVFGASSELFGSQTKNILGQIEDFLALDRNLWPTEALRPVSAGQYDEAVPARAVEILKSFYKEHNQNLYAMLNKDFDWL